jgi:hypothetical protein
MQLPGVQSITVPPSPMPASVVPASVVVPPPHFPVITSQVDPVGQPALLVHFAPQIFDAGWHTWPAEPRSQSASVAHWQNARTPASLPEASPPNVAQVFEESGQSTAPVHEATQVRRMGWQAWLALHCESDVQVEGIGIGSPHPAKPSAKPAAVAATSQRLVFFIMRRVSWLLRSELPSKDPKRAGL